MFLIIWLLVLTNNFKIFFLKTFFMASLSYWGNWFLKLVKYLFTTFKILFCEIPKIKNLQQSIIDFINHSFLLLNSDYAIYL